MNFTGVYQISSPRESVFAAITNPHVIQSCMDACEQIVQTGPNQYDAHLILSVAGRPATYVGKITISDLNPPESYSFNVEGNATAGSVSGITRVRLLPLPTATATQLECEITGTVGGMLGLFGSRAVERVALQMMEQFFQSFAHYMNRPSSAK